MPRRSLYAIRVFLLLLCVSSAAEAAPELIVIGQSLPLTGAGFPVANRVQGGAKAYVERVNATGGIQGRRLELVTLDDGGDTKRIAENVSALVRKHNAVAIVNCLGEQACLAVAEATRELRVPLVGPISGALALRSRDVSHVFSLRPDDTTEANALARQLKLIGILKVALMADRAEPTRTEALAAAMQRADLTVTRFAVDTRPDSIAIALQGITRSGSEVLVLNLGYEALESLGRLPEAALAEAPSMIATLSSAGLTQLTRLFRDRLVGYTSVVPSPEGAQVPIVRELQQDADAFIGPEAVSFEGLEAYINLRLCVEALRRIGPRIDGPRLSKSIESLGTIDLGGFGLTLGRERHHGSSFVEIGMRGRNGRLR